LRFNNCGKEENSLGPVFKIHVSDETLTVIDFHNHFYPKGYVEELKTGKGYASMVFDSRGRLIANYSGDYNIVVAPHITLEDRLRDMKKFGIDLQVLTLTTPGVERESVERGKKLAKITNDEFSEIAERHRDSFTALATLPMQDPEGSVTELERAVRDRGLKGAIIFSNVNGLPLDSPQFFPIFEKATSLDVPLFIHPTSPMNSSYMDEFRLVPILGFGVDTTLSIFRLVFSGIMERLPSLKLVATHTGGVYPHLRGRAEIAYHAYPECKVNISHPPSTYLKRIWMDTVCYDEDVIVSSLDYVGADKMLMGTDYPHQITDIENAVGRVERLKIDEAGKRKIFSDNALKLLKL
jgi:aminocarboxymuconate-semialdehyde decarboxylase